MEKIIYCFSYFLAKSDYREQLAHALKQLIEPTLLEADCLQYELLADDNNPLHFIMLEKFTSHEALELHEQQPYIKKFVEQQMDLYCEKVSWHIAKKIF